MRLKKIERSVLQTLLYSDIFDFPLTRQELHERLISHSSRPAQTFQAINDLLARSLIQKTGKFLHFPDRSSIVGKRKKRQTISGIKMVKAHRHARLLQQIPSILAIFVTGSLAVSSSRPDDDIDFLIVARPASIWQTRPLALLLLELLHVRRKPASHNVSDKVCANIWLTPDSLRLPKNRRSLYTAFELVQARPILDKSGIHAQLLSQNDWLQAFLPNFPLPSLAKSALPRSNPSFLEKLAFKLQYRYMRPKITNELINLDFAFFHPRSLTPVIMKRLKSRQTQYDLNLF